MAFFVISYDLRKKAEFDYENLWEEFARLDTVKFQESEYFLSARNTAKGIKDHFLKFIHEDDLLMVVEFENRPSYSRSLKGTNAWVEKHWPD